MTNLTSALLAAMLAAPLAGAAFAQEQDAGAAGQAAEGADQTAASVDVAGMTCAEFLELDDEGRNGAMEALGVEIGMSQSEADDMVEAGEIGQMTTACEATPDMEAMAAFQNAIGQK